MKFIALPLTAALMLYVNPAHALTESEKAQAVSVAQKEVTGLEWLQMSIGDRMEYVMKSI